MGPRTARTQAHEPQRSLDPQSSPNRADPGQIPMNRIPGFPYQLSSCQNTKSHSHTHEGSELPPDDSIRITRGLGGYTRWVRSHAPSSESKYPPGNSIRITQGLRGYTLWQVKSPPGDSIRITRGLGGYYQGRNTEVPNEVKLITIER